MELEWLLCGGQSGTAVVLISGSSLPLFQILYHYAKYLTNDTNLVYIAKNGAGTSLFFCFPYSCHLYKNQYEECLISPTDGIM